MVRRTVVRGERETNQQIRVLNLNRRPNINSRPSSSVQRSIERCSKSEREKSPPNVPWRNRGNDLRRPTNERFSLGFARYSSGHRDGRDTHTRG